MVVDVEESTYKGFHKAEEEGEVEDKPSEEVSAEDTADTTDAEEADDPSEDK